MAKGTGLAQNFYLHGLNLSGDVGAIDKAASPRAVLDVTAIDKSAVERVLARIDGLLEFSVYFNDASEQEHASLKGMPTTDVLVVYANRETIGAVAGLLRAKQVNYDWARGQDMSLVGKVQCVADGVPLEWGEMLTAGPDLIASSGSQASKDDAASTSYGLMAILHIFDIGSGTPTVVIEDSPNNSTWATLVSFAAVAAGSDPTAERVVVNGTVDRYLRITVTGTFTNLSLAIAYRRGTAFDISDLGYGA